MILYQSKYKTKTKIDKCFAYFLSKNYLLKTLPINSNEIFRIQSDRKSKFLEEGEDLVIYTEDHESIINIDIAVEKVVKNKLIRFNIRYKDFIDKGSEESEEEKKEFLNFMNKQIPDGIVYELTLETKGNYIEIIETSTVNVIQIWKKILVKLFCWYHQFSNKKTRKIILKELNSL